MSDATTIGTLLLNDSLPEELHLKGKVLDKAELTKLLRAVAEKYPDRYKEVLKTLNDVGRSAAYAEGVTVSLSGLQKSKREKAIIRRARARVRAIAASDMSEAEKKQALIDTMLPMVEKMQTALKEEAEAEDNPYWFQVKSGARGKMGDFNAIRGASGLVNDHRDELVPVPILHSLGEGLDPVEYWAGTYGQRRGMIDVKFSQVLETQVLMSDLSSKRLGDIKAGDVVMGSDTSGNLRPTRVVAFHDHGVQETWRYTFRRNLTKETLVLEATPDHRMLSRVASAHAYRTDKTPKKRALKEAKLFNDPKKNEYVCVPVAGGDIGSIDEPRALFYGVIAGDGSCGPTARAVEVSQADPLFLAEFGVYMAAYGVTLKKAGKNGYGYRLNGTCNDGPGGVKARNTARLWLEDAGMWGKLAHEKTLPPEAGEWNNASMAAFIAGYASSDGCVDTRGKNSGVSFSICSTSHRLLEQVRDHLLFRWGIHAGLTPVKPRSNMKRPQTKLTISMRQSVELFAASIPLIGQKCEQLDRALEQSPQGRLFPAGYKIISAEPIGPRRVADLEVEHSDHLFVLANGLITSNSVGDAGFLNKQLVNAAHRIVVNKDRPPQTRLPVGLPVGVDDEDNIGAVLAADVGPYKAGTTITSDMLEELKDQEVEHLLIHSPMTEPSTDGGVSRWAAGRRDRTGLSLMGDNLGIPAAQSLGERLAQGMLDCLVEGTEVRMADWSVKQIQDLCPGDWVLGADRAGNSFPVRVNHLFDQGLQPCWEWPFKVGSTRASISMQSTTEHKILANIKKYSCAAEAQNHDLQVVPVGSKAANFYGVYGKGFDDSGLRNEPRALLLGLILGDGGITDGARGVVNLTCADPSQIDDLQPYLAAFNLEAVQNPARPIAYRISKKHGKARRGNPAREFLTELGCWGKYAHEKVIPDAVYQWDNASVAALIAGLIVTDGSVCLGDRSGQKLSIHFGSTSQRMVEQLAELMAWRFGVYAARPTGSMRGGRKRFQHQLHITVWESVKRLVEVLPLIGIKARKAAKWVRLHEPRQRTPHYTLKRQKPIDIGMKQCWDIEVDHPDHLFVLANGLIVSNSKHQAGATGTDKVSRSGFEYINRLIQSPEVFPEAGPLSEVDGVVRGVKEAPQGGHYIQVEDQEYYAGPGINVTVREGDSVGIGQDLTDGTPHPEQLVRLRGIGEARRQYLKILQEGLRNSGINIHRRNAEAVVAGLLNWTKVTDPDGYDDHIVDDIVSYNALAGDYQPREGFEALAPNRSIGRYLEEPVLHYTPGTRITKDVAEELRKWKIRDVRSHTDKPRFQPFMQRGMLGVYNDEDWQTRLSGFYTTSAFLDSVHRGRMSDPNSTSFVPAIAQGTNFGQDLETRGTYGASGAVSPSPAKSVR